MDSRLTQNLLEQTGSYLFPFFWQSGADRKILETELEKIYESNVRSICVEARPHPDYGGPGWWRDMDIIMDFARSRRMEVWLLDDDRFPTGHANGAFSHGDNPLSARFLTVHNTDILGPVTPGYMLVKALLKDDDALLAVTASRRKSGETPDIEPGTTVDITSFVTNGWLMWEVPEGLWRIQVFYTTRQGNGKLDYFNILDSASVSLLLEKVYEPHYQRYKQDFGKTFMGFFSDEPEFSNLPGYDFQARLGHNMPFIPWSRELEQRLRTRWGSGFFHNLPMLWYEAGPDTMHIRYEYMDETTKQLARSFSSQIGAWCAARGVSHIGHIIEDDNSHGRLGCSTGHFFRSESDMRMAGIDVVLLQIMPEMNQEEHQWVASSRDGEFFHYGLGKMGSSLAHIDAKKQGDSMCEIFGAFGWQEGTGLMKWLADHMLSRGINHFVPHAFSQKPYPDPDCPPHFYAQGKNPQYALFGQLMKYMNRLSHLFSGGSYPAETAVLYHADGEWAGDAMLFQKPVRVMLENQLDCDIIPVDMLKKDNPYQAVFRNGIHVGNLCYKTLVIPGCDRIPLAAAEFILEHKEEMNILFVDRLPFGICEKTHREAALTKALSQCRTICLSQLASCLKELKRPLLSLDSYQPELRTYPYKGADGNWYIYCFHEGIRKPVEAVLTIGLPGLNGQEGSDSREILRYDAMHNYCSKQKWKAVPEGFSTKLFLEPGEAFVLVICPKDEIPCREAAALFSEKKLFGKWGIFAKDVDSAQWKFLFSSDGEEAFPDLTRWAAIEGFSGTFAYKTEITASKEEAGDYLLRLFGTVDGVDVMVNNQLADRVVGTPCCCEIPVSEGLNQIEIRLPVTPVWRDGDAWSALAVLPRMGLTSKPILRK